MSEANRGATIRTNPAIHLPTLILQPPSQHIKQLNQPRLDGEPPLGPRVSEPECERDGDLEEGVGEEERG